MKPFLIAVTIAVVLSVSGCGNHPPELNQVYSQINFIFNPDTESITSEFTVLVNADDEDGDDDIDSINVIDDSNQLYWTVEKGKWSERDNRGLKWYGSQRLSTADGSPPAPGEYRVAVTDRGGERADGSVFIPLVDKIPVKDDFPGIQFKEGGGLMISSPQNKNIISFYDESGVLLRSWSVTPGFLDVAAITEGPSIAQNYRSCKIAYYSNSYGAGLVAGPYFRRD